MSTNGKFVEHKKLGWNRIENLQMEIPWLPDEIWEQILFSYDLYPNDLLNCYKLNPTWARVVLCKVDIVTLLLAEVIPLIQQYLGPTELLQCRQVCSTWREIIDSCVVPAPRFTFKHGVGSKRNDTNLGVHLSEIGNQFKNPFPFRQLGIFRTELYTIENFESHLHLLGREVFHLFIAFDSNVINEFFTIFSYFPNLKTLSISIHSPDYLKRKRDNLFNKIEDMAIFEKLAASDLLHRLEALKIDYLGLNVFPWLTEFSNRAGPRLHTFVVKALQKPEANVENPTFQELPKTLTELSLKTVNLYQGLALHWQNIPLKSITLSIKAQKMDATHKNEALSGFLKIFISILVNCFGTLEKFSFLCEKLPCFEKKVCCTLNVNNPSRKCVCNKIFNSGGVTEDINVLKTLQISCNSLKVLNISHYFLHPRIFPKIMKICGKIKELKINDFHKTNFAMFKLSNGDLTVEKVILQLWPECGKSLNKISVQCFDNGYCQDYVKKEHLFKSLSCCCYANQ